MLNFAMAKLKNATIKIGFSAWESLLQCSDRVGISDEGVVT
jgi:hypothetical protein